jgi:archaellum biogenesis ATPase FlaH
MREKHVLSSVIKSREAYNAIADHVQSTDLSEQGWLIWQRIAAFYGLADSETTRCDGELLAADVSRQVSANTHKEMFEALVLGLVEFDTSPANVVDDLLATKREVAGQLLASALLTGGKVNGLLDTYQSVMAMESFDEASVPEVRQGFSVTELCTTGFDPEGLIQLYPTSLNDRMDGGVKPGHHIVVFGRPEMGKTLLVIELMAGFLRQGLTTLYIGNEDPIDDINMRVINRLTQMNKFDVLNDPARADARAREANYELLIMASLAPGTVREITGLIDTHAPDVLVLDQLRNLDMKNDNRVLALEEAARQAREWAKRYSCVVVSVTQAGDSAEGKAVLDMGDVDWSNTGIPGACDVIIGIGANEKNKQRGEIVISLPKNKVSGKHEFFPVLIDPALSQLIPLD